MVLTAKQQKCQHFHQTKSVIKIKKYKFLPDEEKLPSDQSQAINKLNCRFRFAFCKSIRKVNKNNRRLRKETK